MPGEAKSARLARMLATLKFIRGELIGLAQRSQDQLTASACRRNVPVIENIIRHLAPLAGSGDRQHDQG